MDAFWAAPPITRTLAAATLATSVLVYGGFIEVRLVIFYLPWLLKLPPQLWRLVTPFLLTGPKWAVIFDTYFLYTYGTALETGSPRFSKKGDFFIFIIFSCVAIIAMNAAYLGGYVFNAALCLALAYIYSQDNRGRKVKFVVVPIPVLWLPYAMLVMTLVMDGPQAALIQASGLPAAHLFDFLTRLYPTFGGGKNYIQTPYFVTKWFGGDGPSPITRAYGTVLARAPAAQPNSRQGPSRIPSGISNLWSGRGTGRRLGGE